MTSEDSLLSIFWLIWPWAGFETAGDQLTTLFSLGVILLASLGCWRQWSYHTNFLKPLALLGKFFVETPFQPKRYEAELKKYPLFLQHRILTILNSTFERDGRFFTTVVTDDFLDPDGFRIEALRARVAKREPLLGYSTLAALPNLLTAIGILGTFIGLVYGLDGSVNGGGVAIEQLIDGLKVSFRTSVWGLFGSIVLTVVNKSVATATESEVQRLVQALDGKFARTSTEGLLSHLLLEQKEATGALKTLKTDLSVALQEAVAKEIAPTLNQLASSTQESHAEGVGKVIDQVIANIGEELSGVAQQLQSTADGWLEVGTKLREVTQAQTQLSEKFATTVQQLESSSQSVVEAHQRLNPVTERLETAGTQLNELTSSLGQLVTTLQDSGDEYGESVAKLTQVLEQQWGAWAELSSHFQATAEGLNRGLSHFTESFPRSIEQTMIEFDKELAQVSRNLAGATGELKLSFDDLNDRIADVLSPNDS